MSSSQPRVMPVVVGVDIGGTNTDVVIISHRDQRSEVVAEVKELTSSDVNTGVKKALLRALLQTNQKGLSVSPILVNIGTTQFVNALVQGRDLVKVAVIRICGPISHELPPFVDFPKRLKNIIAGPVHLIKGWIMHDGKEHEKLNEEQIRKLVREQKDLGIKNIAFIGIFSPTRADHELRAREITKEEYPEATVSLSHEVGHIGLLERENATILNECLKPLCQKTVSGFKTTLEEIGLNCPFFLTQNDGTIIGSEAVKEHPVLTFASGPTNSMRGATFLSDLKDAIVVDIGGTTADVGVIKNGFPREASSHVKVGGVRTNFRMPDVLSIGLGGGSYVKEEKNEDGTLKRVTVGPVSAGLNLLKEAFVFGDGKDVSQRSLTATDIAVASGLYSLGDAKQVQHLDKTFVQAAVDEIHRMVEDLVDKIKLSTEELPVIVVGGGSILMDLNRRLKGATKLIVPKHSGVANAIGAALSKLYFSENIVVNLLDMVDVEEMQRCVDTAVKAITNDPDGKEADRVTQETKKPFFVKAKDKAIEDVIHKVKKEVVALGGDANSLEVLNKMDSKLAYMPGNATRINVKVVGDLAACDEARQGSLQEWKVPGNSDAILQQASVLGSKQTYSSTGQKLSGGRTGADYGAGSEDDESDWDPTKHPQDPYIDPATGEWILSEWDMECILLGAGLYGCGGGGNIHVARLRCLNSIRSGKRFRVIHPERLLKAADPLKDVVIVSAAIGVPLIVLEQGICTTETTRALECLQDAYEIGGYKDGNLQNVENVNVETNTAGQRFITNYQPPADSDRSGMKIIGVMPIEIGGLNSAEPLLIAANMDLPVLDADGMSRALPEVQMFIPYMSGKPPYPVGIVGSGNEEERSLLLYSTGNKMMETYLRDVCIANGCSGGVSIPLVKDEILQSTALYTVSSAYRLGDVILRARLDKVSVVDAIVHHENGKHVITGKVTGVQIDTSGGFNRGYITIEGLDEFLDHKILIEFQNENLVIFPMVDGKRGKCIGSVPDLICIIEPNSGEPAQTEEVKYGMRVAVLLMPSHHLLRRPESLKWVGPQAFHYADEIQFQPFRERNQTVPVPPQ